MTKDECARQIVEAMNDLVRDLKKLADQYGDPSEFDYRAGIMTAAGYVNRCVAALALALPVEAEGEVVR